MYVPDGIDIHKSMATWLCDCSHAFTDLRYASLAGNEHVEPVDRHGRRCSGYTMSHGVAEG
eukprot:m.1667589 g.1667589  ORF g.1667589 m.1667589 type:complete len:61 (-) comp149051_c0_seq1:41-223(-)